MAGRWTPCAEPGCPHLRPRDGDCPDGHGKAKQRTYNARRGTAARRGYGALHRTRFRAPVLQRDPICVLCNDKPSEHADHWPHTRRELVALGLNPNDPKHGRGLCASCHASETAKYDGGFGRPTTPLDEKKPHAP